MIGAGASIQPHRALTLDRLADRRGAKSGQLQCYSDREVQTRLVSENYRVKFVRLIILYPRGLVAVSNDLAVVYAKADITQAGRAVACRQDCPQTV